MKKFKYKAWDSSFKIVKGIVEEEDIETAAEKLKGQNLKIISISKKNYLFDSGINNKILKNEEVASICGQIAIIINSGVTIVTGLEVLRSQNKKLSGVFDAILNGVKRGSTLGISMEETERFPKLLTDMVKAGELSGNIDEVLFNMEEYYEREAAIKNKIKSASIYPIILVFVTIGVIIFFNILVFPKLRDLFSDAENLPAVTKGLFATLNFITNNYIAIIMASIGLFILSKYLKTIARVRYFLDKASFRVPVLGGLKMLFIITRFSRSMGIFIRSAVPLLSALESIELIVNNKYIGKKISSAKNDIINGSKLADAFAEQQLFDPLVIQMIRIGEETGRLEEMLEKVAEIYDKKVETNMTRVTALVEPVFTLIIGVLAAVVILAIALPIMQMSGNIK